MNDEAYALRPGETAVELPAAYDAGLYFIGRIRTPWTRRQDCPKNPSKAQGITCRIELDERYAAGLEAVEGTSHLVVLYFMDRARRDLIRQKPTHAERPRGTFSLRSPVRPNPIAMSVVRLIGIEGTTLLVEGLDCLDGTPLIDIKPYYASIDSKPEAVVGADVNQKR